MSEPGEVMRGRRARPRTPLVLLGLVVGAAAVIAIAFSVGRAAPPPAAAPPTTAPPDPVAAAEDTADAFLNAWEAEDWEELQSLVSDQSLDAAQVHKHAIDTLRVTAAEYTAGEPEVDGDEATVPFEAAWQLEGLDDYEFSNTLRLTSDADSDTGWAVQWWYTTVHPDLAPDTTFERARDFPERAPILDVSGRPLATTREVVVVGIQPARVEEARVVRSALQELTDARTQRVRSVLRRRKRLDPGGFYAVAEMPAAQFEARRPQLFPVKGLVFRREQRRREHAPAVRALLGGLGPITAEQLEELGSPYAVGDRVGQTGLERVFEKQLAGTPSLEAAITDDVGLVRSLGFRGGTDPQPVRTTLDRAAQRAAQRALRKAPAPAAMVVLDVKSAGVRAAAFTPSNGFNRAFSGLYPPGSTFKVITSYAALDNGRTSRTMVDCPGRIRVADRYISNDGGAAYGRVTLRRALAVSCNTTYARLGARLGAATMRRTSELFGFNAAFDFTVPAATPQFPTPESLAEITRASIGQGRVQASPLAMANVAATIASGQYRAPTLVDDEASEPEAELDTTVRRNLVRMMRAVVTEGTGRVVNLRGEPVFGKTGTAQYGGPKPHAWFIGFRGDLAFAVVVETSGHGGTVAAPVARDFLQGLRDR